MLPIPIPKPYEVSTPNGAVQKDTASKAASAWARAAYMEYVSTTRERERRWRDFSTAPKGD